MKGSFQNGKGTQNHVRGAVVGGHRGRIATAIGEGIPYNIISSSCICPEHRHGAQPAADESGIFGKGVNFTSKQILKLIILMGVTPAFLHR